MTTTKTNNNEHENRPEELGNEPTNTVTIEYGITLEELDNAVQNARERRGSRPTPDGLEVLTETETRANTANTRIIETIITNKAITDAGANRVRVTYERAQTPSGRVFHELNIEENLNDELVDALIHATHDT